MSTLVASESLLPASLQEVLTRRGLGTPEAIEAFLNPSLDYLSSPHQYPQMDKAVQRLRQAIDKQDMIAVYADRDVDGLTGLTILLRTLRTLGASVIWGSPLKGRGLERDILQGFIDQKAKVLIFVDCGTSEDAELHWLQDQGVDVMVADHHRLAATRPPAFAWIHPEMVGGQGETPAGCVMAFKLAQALWLSFLGTEDPERMDYFLYEHIDLLALGILADRMPLTGENRVFVWHGLRRMAHTRKVGLSALLRFFRLTPRPGPISVREATWQLIPLLNAAGRLREPQWTVQLLMTEEAWTARSCIDHLIKLNSQRRDAQEKSMDHFEKMVIEQCAIESDPVLVAIAEDLEPSVTGLAAQSLVRKYNRPAILFVAQGDQAVGSARGTSEVDLYAWVETQKELIVKFGGHSGAVGLTIHRRDFALFRERILSFAQRESIIGAAVVPEPEASVSLEEINLGWWQQLQRLEPFGPGFACPVFEIPVVDEIVPLAKPRARTGVSTKPAAVQMRSGHLTVPAEFESIEKQNQVLSSAGPWRVVGYPLALKGDVPFKWMIQEASRGE